MIFYLAKVLQYHIYIQKDQKDQKYLSNQTFLMNIFSKPHHSIFIGFYICCLNIIDWSYVETYAQSFQQPLQLIQGKNCQKLVDILAIIQSTHNYYQTSEHKMSIAFDPSFSNIIKTVSSDSIYKKILASAQKKYLIKNLGLQTLNPEQVVRIIYRNAERPFVFRTGKQTTNKSFHQTIWALNQFKVFVWISVCYAYTKNKQLQSFGQQDYEFLQSIFSKKSLQFLQYHFKTFEKKNKNYRVQWNEQQTELLNKIIKKQLASQKELIWSEISLRIFVESQKLYYRTPQKCRQKWYNHLNPQVNRNKWTLEEDILLFRCIAKYGLKWALISKQFQGTRTQHMTKNRFNSLVHKYIGKSLKISTKKIVEKVQLELNEKLAKMKKQVVKQESQVIQKLYEQKCCQTNEDQLINEKDIVTIKMEQSTIENKWSSSSLDQILFNQMMIELQQPISEHSKIELIEVQINGELIKEDEYISSLII